MITRILLVLSMCIFLNTPSFAGGVTGFKNVFDQVDKLNCPQAVSVFKNQKLEAVQADEQTDADYFRRIVETYALVSKCALNKRTRIELYDGILKGMVAELRDPHSKYLNEEAYKEFKEQSSGQFVGIGVSLEQQQQNGVLQAFRVVATHPGAPAEKAGLRDGDTITKVNDRTVMSYTSFDEALKSLKGERGTTLNLLVTREGVSDPFVVAVVRDEVKTEFVKTTLLPNKWFVAKINLFLGNRFLNTRTLELCTDIQSAYARALTAEPKLKGFVLDLRDNPGGLLDGASCVVDLFATESLRGQALISIEMREGLKAYPATIDPKDILKGKPLIVLVNERSASASEIVAKAIQYYNLGVVVGTKTFGKGSIQEIIPLADNKTAVKYTFAQYLVGPVSAPTPVQGVGVTPNIIAKKKSSGSEAPKTSRLLRESDLSGALETSILAKDIVVKNTKETNPALYTDIYNLLTQDPFNLEFPEQVIP